MKRPNYYLKIIVISILLVPQIVHAYVGPGAGLGAIGTVLALFGAIFLGIIGFIWYPVKRLLGLRKRSREQQDNRQPESVKSAAGRADAKHQH